MNGFDQLLDPIPVVVVFVLVCLVALAMYEVGLRLGRWWQQRSSEAAESAQSPLVAPLVGMLAFLLAVTMGMAADRFNTRRGIVREETSAIEKTYLRAGYLVEPYRNNIRSLLREYVPLRIENSDVVQLEADYARSKQLHGKLWTEAEALVRDTANTPTLALFIASLNELIDLHTTRVTARIYARVPETVIVVLLLGAVLTMGVVGYNAGLTAKRGSMVTTVVLIVALGAVITLVVDLDRPREGFLQVSQQPLIDLQRDLGTPDHK